MKLSAVPTEREKEDIRQAVLPILESYRSQKPDPPSQRKSATKADDETLSALKLLALTGEADEDSEDDPGTVEDEFQRYLNSKRAPKTIGILAWWQSQQSIYPTLFRAAMDYLPIQASAVPCERVFSSAGETATKRRNRMKPELMEALQMLKFMLKKKHLDFMEGWRGVEDSLADFEDDSLGLDNLLAATEASYMKILNILVQDDKLENGGDKNDAEDGKQEVGKATKTGAGPNEVIVVDN